MIVQLKNFFPVKLIWIYTNLKLVIYNCSAVITVGHTDFLSKRQFIFFAPHLNSSLISKTIAVEFCGDSLPHPISWQKHANALRICTLKYRNMTCSHPVLWQALGLNTVISMYYVRAFGKKLHCLLLVSYKMGFRVEAQAFFLLKKVEVLLLSHRSAL